LRPNKQAANQEIAMAKSNNKAASLTRAIATSWRTLSHDLFETYHPERHYMRGPGPKWREKHGQALPAQAYEQAAPAMTPAHA
jgi:hypothetical protein